MDASAQPAVFLHTGLHSAGSFYLFLRPLVLLLLVVFRLDVLRLLLFLPAADIFAIFFLPYFFLPMYAASAFGFLAPRFCNFLVSVLNLLPLPNFALRAITFSYSSALVFCPSSPLVALGSWHRALLCHSACERRISLTATSLAVLVSFVFPLLSGSHSNLTGISFSILTGRNILCSLS